METLREKGYNLEKKIQLEVWRLQEIYEEPKLVSEHRIAYYKLQIFREFLHDLQEIKKCFGD